MSGRGRGRSGGRGRGRGGRRNFERSSNKTSSSNSGARKERKSVSDYIYYIGSAKQASDFTVVTSYLINHIRKTYSNGDDIGDAIETRTPMDLNKVKPTMLSTTTVVDPTATDEEKAQQQLQLDKEIRENEMMYEAEIKSFVDRKRMYVTNLGKAYAFILEQCNKALKSKLYARKDFDSIIKGNPIELLNAIEEHSMSYVENRYEISTVLESLKNFVNLKQHHDESLIDYTLRFKSARDILKSHIGGKIKLHKIAETLPGWDKRDEEKQKQCYNRAYDAFVTLLYLENADRNKYGSLLSGLSTQFSLGQDQYPRELTDATNVLSNHKFDLTYHQQKKRQKDKATQQTRPGKTQNTTDDNKPIQELSFAQMEKRCFCCGKVGHISDKCHKRNSTPKSDWAMNKTPEMMRMKQQLQQHVQQQNPQPSDTSSVTTNTTETPSTSTNVSNATDTVNPFGWMHHQVMLNQSSDHQQRQLMKGQILLDSQSSVDLFCNPKFVEDISPSTNTLQLATNAGTMQTKEKATVPKYGEVWFDQNAITNVFSLANMTRKHRVTFDSRIKNAFIVHTDQGPMTFSVTDNNLYVYDPISTQGRHPHNDKEDDDSPNVNMIQSVTENETFYTKRQLERAKTARNLLHALGNPTIEDLRRVLRLNTIKNCPVTSPDLDIMKRVYGPDPAPIKGKTTRRKPSPVVHDIIAIPPELIKAQRLVELCMDTMFINGMPYLTSISKRIMYRTAQWVKDRTMSGYRSAFERILRLYVRAGFKVNIVCTDNEFYPLLEPIKTKHGFATNYASAGEHEPHAERNNRTIQERVRSAYHGSPYKNLPRLVLQRLVEELTRKLNYFPNKHGCSMYYSPREIMHHIPLDYDKQCRIAPLSYVLAHDEPQPTNTQRARALDSVYLRPLPNAQGGHEVYHIPTKKVITRRNVTELPVTPVVIKAINDIATKDGIKSLKITNRSGHLLFDSSVPAGVGIDNAVNNDTDIETMNEDAISDAPSEYSDDHDEMDPNDIYNEDPATDQFTSDDEQESNDKQDENAEAIQQAEGLPEEESDVEEPELRRSSRERNKPETIIPSLHGKTYETSHAQASTPASELEYTPKEARVVATIMCQLRERGVEVTTTTIGVQHVMTYSLKKGLHKFGQRGKDATTKEMKQMLDRDCFQPIRWSSMNLTERKRTLESLIFLTEKRDGTVKTRHCANGSTQRDYMDREEVSSPTVTTESTLLTSVIEAEERRDVATADIPNAFIQTDLDKEDENGNRTIMKIRGQLVDILCELDDVYKDYVEIERAQKVLYVHLTKAIYGLMVSSMLFYKRLVTDLTGYGFTVNPYDPCVANKMVDGKQMTVSWHVDDLKASHKNPEVINDFITWIKETYGKIGKVKVVRGRIHDYLGMELDYTVDGQVSVGMIPYIKSMVEDFPQEELEGSRVPSPWNDNLFKVDGNSPKLSKERTEKFHTVTARGLFACKRARPDISPAIAYLTTRVRSPNESDWSKLVRMMKFLKHTVKDRLTLKSDGSRKLHWHVDASFAVHPDFRSHTGATFKMGRGAISSISRKQGMNTRSSTEAEVVAADEVVGPMIWTLQFLEAQGYSVKENILYQDNRSAMLLETNGRKSAGKRSRHLNIRYFFVTDQKKKGRLTISYCPTDQMLGDYMTKPTHGKKFKTFRAELMNLPNAAQMMMLACYTKD